MKKIIFMTLAMFLQFAPSAYADDSSSQEPAFEAGTEKAKLVADDPAILGIINALSQQAEMTCFPETLGHPPVSALQTLVGFYKENEISKFLVNVYCSESEQFNNLKYEIIGIFGDSGNRIESVKFVGLVDL